MSKFKVGVDEAFKVGVSEGKKEAYRYVLQVIKEMEGTSKLVKKIIETELNIKPKITKE